MQCISGELLNFKKGWLRIKKKINKMAFGQTRFAAAADSIEHISEEKFLLQIFSKMGDLMI